MATVSWLAKLDSKEHKNWLMVGCALNLAKNGITQLIQREMEAWYKSLISSPPLQSLGPCTCVPGSPTWCGTCVTWKMELKRHHKFNQPKISNSDRTQWSSVTGAWEIAKVFMSTLGSRKTQVVDAETTDIGGLLNLLEQCPFIQPPVNPIVLSSARDQCRNHWAHAPKQELPDADVNTIFGHLNNLLNDPVFYADSPAQQSAKDLQDLFNHGLVSVRESEIEALHLLRQSLVTDLTKCQDDLADVNDKVVQMDTERRKVNTVIKKDISEVREQGDLNREEIIKLKQHMDNRVKEIKTDLNDKVSKVLNAVEDFNMQLSERDDLKGEIQLIIEDVGNIAMELTTTKSQVAKLEINLKSFQREVEIKFARMESEVKGLANNVATNANTISSLQKDFMEVKEEVETLIPKSLEEQNSNDSDALRCTAPSRLTAFTGRQVAVAWLEQNLAPDQRSENLPGMGCRTKAICGLGGCGKTSLAAEFSWSYKNRFPGGVFWINGESDENISISVVENLALLNIRASTSEKLDDILNKFLTRLSREKRPWLLVVDNADDLEDPACPTGLKKIFKGSWQRNGNAFKYGHILLTTRRSAKDTETFLKLTSENCFQLQCFSEEEGALFLMRRIGLQGEFLDPDAILLAKELGCLPLALEQAAAYICGLPTPCTFKGYLKKYQDVKLRLFKLQPATALSVEAQHRLSVHTTWEINFEFVKENSPAAAGMMCIAAFFESENVPIDVINPGFPELDQEELRERARSEVDVDAILKVLSSYSLFLVDQKRRVFAIHKLVQEVVRESLTPSARMKTLKEAFRVLHFAFKESNERDIFIGLLLSFRTLKNHAEDESKLLKEDRLHALYNSEILELCHFVCNFKTDDISLFGVAAELLEFKLRVLGVVFTEADQPDLLLSTMVQTSTLKLARSVPKIDKEAKELSDNAVTKLIELEESGVKVNVDVKFDVLKHNAFFHVVQEQWEENYNVLLKLEELPISLINFVELQLLIARVEYFLSPSNPQPVLERYENTLKIVRQSLPSDDLRIIGLLQDISNVLCMVGKVEEAKPYAEELWKVCKKHLPTSTSYIFGTATAMTIKSYFDPDDSENILVDILKHNWPNIYKIAASLPQREISMEEITGDGTDSMLVKFLPQMLDLFSAICTRKTVKHNFSSNKLSFYKTIADINLCIKKSHYGEIHPAMQEPYSSQQLVHLILENEEEVLRLSELVDKCKQLVPDKRSVHQITPWNASLLRIRKYKDCANIFFRKGKPSQALELYNRALSLSPNDAKLLTNKAATCVKLSEQGSAKEKHECLEQALQASQEAITADPSWLKGYYWKAVCLAHLDKRGPSLAAAAVAKHLFPSQCAKIPAVVDRFGSYVVQVATKVQELRHATERRNTQNLVIVVKEGRYELPSPLNIPKNVFMVGLGEVQICCPRGGFPLELEETSYMENISLYPTLESIERKSQKKPN